MDVRGGSEGAGGGWQCEGGQTGREGRGCGWALKV